MKFGLFGGAKSAGEGSVGDSLGYRKYIDYVVRAEELGFHSVFVVEHHFTGVGQLSASLNFLSYLAARTQRMRLGTAVVVLPWHHPVLLAEQVATLDLLSMAAWILALAKATASQNSPALAFPLQTQRRASMRPWPSCARPGPPPIVFHITEAVGILRISLSNLARSSNRIRHCGWEPAVSNPSGAPQGGL